MGVERSVVVAKGDGEAEVEGEVDIFGDEMGPRRWYWI